MNKINKFFIVFILIFLSTTLIFASEKKVNRWAGLGIKLNYGGWSPDNDTFSSYIDKISTYDFTMSYFVLPKFVQLTLHANNGTYTIENETIRNNTSFTEAILTSFSIGGQAGYPVLPFFYPYASGYYSLGQLNITSSGGVDTYFANNLIVAGIGIDLSIAYYNGINLILNAEYQMTFAGEFTNWKRFMWGLKFLFH